MMKDENLKIGLISSQKVMLEGKTLFVFMSLRDAIPTGNYQRGHFRLGTRATT